MIQEQLMQLQMKFLLGYNMKMVIYLGWKKWTFGGGMKIW